MDFRFDIVRVSNFKAVKSAASRRRRSFDHSTFNHSSITHWLEIRSVATRSFTLSYGPSHHSLIIDIFSLAHSLNHTIIH